MTEPESASSAVLIVGDRVHPVGLQVGDKLFVFNPNQIQFLLNLQKLKNVTAAALSIGKNEEWAKSFLASPKFKSYINCKMAEYSVKNGLTVEWWYQYGKWIADGKRDWYKAECTNCTYTGTMNVYEIESYRGDDMAVAVPCAVCAVPLKLTLETEVFLPSREKVEVWKEFGSRLIPKVERVHHQFSKEEFVFEEESK